MFRTLTRKVLVGFGLFYVVLALVVTAIFMITQRSREVNNYLANHTTRFVLTRAQYIFYLYHTLQESQEYLAEGLPQDREEANEALAEAEKILATLKTLDTQDRSAVGLPPYDHSVTQARTQLFADVTLGVTAALRAKDSGNEVDLERAIEGLADIADELKDYVDSSDIIVQEEIDAANATIAVTNRQSLLLVPITLIVITVGLGIGLWVLRRNMIAPIRRLRNSTQAVAEGNLDIEIPIQFDDELGELQRAFNEMVAQLRERRQENAGRQAEIERNLDSQRQLLETIKELSTPLLPVGAGIVALPIIGHVDSQRAESLMKTLLEGIQGQHAMTAILDVTGIPMIDTHVMQLLLQTVQAVKLLGSRVVLAGISPTMAHTIVEQGINLTGLDTYRDLAEAISMIQTTSRSLL